MTQKEKIKELEETVKTQEAVINNLTVFLKYSNIIGISALASLNRAYLTISKDAANKFEEKKFFLTYNLDENENILAFIEKLDLKNKNKMVNNES